MFPFNVRVYGLLIENGKILLTHECLKSLSITKFPGGGLEFGEGPKECVIREFKEELNIDIKINQHFYTTDFFQESAFNKNHQILSLYYLVDRKSISSLSVNSNDMVKDFSWVKLENLSPESLTFPIDQIVARKLQDQYEKLDT